MNNSTTPAKLTILTNGSLPSSGSDTLLANGTNVASRGEQLTGERGRHFHRQDWGTFYTQERQCTNTKWTQWGLYLRLVGFEGCVGTCLQQTQQELPLAKLGHEGLQVLEDQQEAELLLVLGQVKKQLGTEITLLIQVLVLKQKNSEAEQSSSKTQWQLDIISLLQLPLGQVLRIPQDIIKDFSFLSSDSPQNILLFYWQIIAPSSRKLL